MPSAQPAIVCLLFEWQDQSQNESQGKPATLKSGGKTERGVTRHTKPEGFKSSKLSE